MQMYCRVICRATDGSVVYSKHSYAAHQGDAIGKWEALLGGRTRNQYPQENEDSSEETMNFTA